MLKTDPKHQGFTIIELLIVIAIIGVLASMVVIQFRGPQDTARDTKRKSDLRQYATLLEIYANNHGSTYPLLSGVNTISSLCAQLPPGTVCEPDPKYPTGDTQGYVYSSDGAQYMLRANLERNNMKFFVCSNGQSGEVVDTTPDPTNGSCPL